MKVLLKRKAQKGQAISSLAFLFKYLDTLLNSSSANCTGIPILGRVNKGPRKPFGVYSLIMQNLKALYVPGCTSVTKVARFTIKY